MRRLHGNEPELKYGYTSPRWSGEILDCSMPMTFDQFSRCSFDCLYCFSYFQRALKAENPMFKENRNYLELPPTATDPEKVIELFTDKESQFTPYIKRQIPFQWGGLSDPFDMFEHKYRTGLKLLKFFSKIQYPICFSTKSVWWTMDVDYVECFARAQGKFNTKVSIINLDEVKARKVERGVASPLERVKAIHRISNFSKGGVTLRLRPFIIGLSSEDFESLIEQAHAAGASAVSTEFLCLEGRADGELKTRYDGLSNTIGFDVLDFYKRNSPNATGYMRLNWKIKQPYILRMKAVCDKLGMRFYVSDAHWKDLCHNGSCCGLDNTWNYSKAQFTEALVFAREHGRVKFSDIYGCAQELYNFKWTASLHFNTGSARDSARWYNCTMYDYIRSIWNMPNHAKSPYKYFYGLLRPVCVDSNKDVIYEYIPYTNPALCEHGVSVYVTCLKCGRQSGSIIK
jgi:DNA repair photolyase